MSEVLLSMEISVGGKSFYLRQTGRRFPFSGDSYEWMSGSHADLWFPNILQRVGSEWIEWTWDANFYDTWPKEVLEKLLDKPQ